MHSKIGLFVVLSLSLSFLPLHRALAVPINAADKAILYDWVSKWNNISLAYQVNWTTNECSDILRRGESETGLECSEMGQVTSINISGDQASDDSPANAVAGVEISPQLANMTMLKSLTLKYLLLIGTIPNELFTFRSNWEYFIITGNKIWGTIPSAVTQQRNLTHFEVDGNLLDGVVPDFGGLPRLAAFSLRSNNFGCPQPNLRPALFTQTRFPSLTARGACTVDSNVMSRPEDEPGTVCGEPAVHPDSICSVLPQHWLSKTLSSTPRFRLRPTGTFVGMDVDKYRHAIRIIRPNGTSIESPAFNVDIFYLSHYALQDRLHSVYHKLLYLDSYDEMFPEGDSGRKFRFRKRFNGTRNIMDTVWEFIGTSSIKFSLDLQNWDFPEGTDRLSFDAQLSWIAPLFDYKHPSSCIQRPWENREADSEILSCKGTTAVIAVQSDVKFPDVSLTLNFSGTDGNVFMDIPLGYSRDSVGTDYLFPFAGAQVVFPIGKLAGMNYANRSSFRAEMLDRLSREDPFGRQQITLIRTALEMKKFSNSYYDPTVTLTSLFSDDNILETPPATAAGINLGLAIGLPLALVVLLGVVLAFVLSKSLRQKVAPFFSRGKSNVDTLDMDDEDGKQSDEQKLTTSTVWRFSKSPSHS